MRITNCSLTAERKGFCAFAQSVGNGVASREPRRFFISSIKKRGILIVRHAFGGTSSSAFELFMYKDHFGIVILMP